MISEIEDTKSADALRILKTTLKKPEDESKTYVFCSTNDSYLSYVVDWETPGKPLHLVYVYIRVLSTFNMYFRNFSWIIEICRMIGEMVMEKI